MADGRGQKPKTKFVPADRVTVRGNSGEPPTWALVTVVATIGFVVLMFSIPGIAYAIFPFAGSDYFWIGLIFLPIVVLIAAAVVSKSVEFARAQSWTTTTGKIVRSELIVKRHRFPGEPEKIENAPAVEYEFTAGGRKYLGSRIGVGDDTGGANSAATLARYRMGADVTVYYDPNDPKNCVLERGGPFAHDNDPPPITAAAAPSAATSTPAKPARTATSTLTSLFCLAVVGAIILLIFNGTDYFTARFPKGEAKVSVFAICFGLAGLLFFIGYRNQLKQAQSWPSVPGTIVRSEVESFKETDNGHTRTMYRPVVEYNYRVNDRDYQANQIKLGTTSAGSQAFAAKAAGKYPAGAAVDVRYEPGNPGNAALENPIGSAWLILLIPLGCFALAAYTLGLFK
jgi:hypothetical protein